jgi:ABC-type transporter Mla MlaB component
MLYIKTDDCENSTTLCLQGRLAGDSVMELERAWRLARDSRHRSLRLDLRHLGAVDTAGKDLLRDMFSQGVEFVVSSSRTY